MFLFELHDNHNIHAIYFRIISVVTEHSILLLHKLLN